MPVEASFPEPLVIEPLSGVHRHTIILLHGRGGSAETFGPALLNTSLFTTSAESVHSVGEGQTAGDGDCQPVTAPDFMPNIDNTIVEWSDSVPPACIVTPDDVPFAGIPCNPAVAQRASRNITCRHIASHRQHMHGPFTTLAEALPHAKFIFPNAPKQRATIYKRSVMRQWFDDWHLRPELSGDVVNHRYDEGLQTSGLGDTVRYLHELIAKEANLAGGVENVILGGISQGCAASLVAALLWEGDGRLGAVVGMCGWLPYLAQMKEAMQAQTDSTGVNGEGGDGFEIFERSTSPLASPPVTGSDDVALTWLRDEIELPSMQSLGSCSGESRKTPVILCHGWDDKNVDRYQGQAAADFLLCLNMEVRHWKLYDGVGHEYSEEMLADILGFLESVLQGASSSKVDPITNV